MKRNQSGRRLTERDLEIARWIAEQQAVRLDTIELLLRGTTQGQTSRNVRRLAQRWTDAGLVMRGRLLADAPTILWPTAEAMRLTDLDDRRTEKRPSLGTLQHTLAVARVRVEYERLGAHWRCERALRKDINAGHLADGMAVHGEHRILVEVDRTRKESQRLGRIMATNARTPSVTGVHYWTTDALLPILEREREQLDDVVAARIQIRLLPGDVR